MKRALLIALLVAIMALYLALDPARWLNLATLQQQQHVLTAWVDQHFALAAGGFFLIYLVSTALSLPGAALLTLISAPLLGAAWALPLVSLASTLGACLAFVCARFLLRDWVRRRFARQLEAIDQGLARDGERYLLTLRLVPLFPFFLVNLLMGLTKMRLWTYAWVSMVGMLPATLIFVLAGRELGQLASTGQVLSPGLLLSLCLLGLLPWLGKWLNHRLAHWRLRRRWPMPRRFDYNLLVIGAGAGGLVTSYVAAASRARVALVEANTMGGDCLNHGCVPSKALLRAARFAAEQRRAGELGFSPATSEPDFAAIMTRVAQVIAEVAPHDSVARYRSLGVDCLPGRARLISPWEAEVAGRTYSARHLVIATGARPRVPPIPGLETVNYLTSDTIWALRAPPRHLLILGGGAIGCELAQALALLGVPVTLIEQGDHLLPAEDPEIGRLLADRLERDGVRLLLGTHCLSATQQAERISLSLLQASQTHTIEGDQLLLALGRQANVQGLGLEKLGVALTPQGTIHVDETLATSLPGLYAVGDVAGPYQLTHAAAYQGGYAALNALAGGLWRFRADYSAIPRAIFTEPQIARVGLNGREAKANGIAVECTRFALHELDRAICDAEREGYVEVITRAGSDRILGATIVGPEAGERIAEFVLAMRHNLGLGKILATVHAYPTRMEANAYVAGQWRRDHAPRRLLALAECFHRWCRRAPAHKEPR